MLLGHPVQCHLCLVPLWKVAPFQLLPNPETAGRHPRTSVLLSRSQQPPWAGGDEGWLHLGRLFHGQ